MKRYEKITRDVVLGGSLLVAGSAVCLLTALVTIVSKVGL